ncbi:proteasome subunit beta type-7-like isoform X1 [Oncorhynchus kisutch]|uniref:proteasome subunit beta type-7-like isoform X1 n=1 Tax=Oncorhynchus kisutch TaxID=8019 RepID=UPI0012DC6EA3|nr:proteasome subunit beta type-7-like isoform X1 [Oncorhynchus kisutch]
MIVADKNCSKIHYSLSTGHLPRVGTANRMLKQMLFRYQGHIGAALVLGGMDCNGPHLYSIYPHGSTDKLPYVTMGGRCQAAGSGCHRGRHLQRPGLGQQH